MKTIRPIEVMDRLSDLRRAGSLRGQPTGFRSLDRLISLRRGFPLFVAGAPGHGKSILVKQIALNSARMHGWRTLAYMGEEGSGVDLIADLVEMFVGKDLRLQSPGGLENTLAMTDSEFEEALIFVNDHFRVICPDEVPSPFTLEAFHDVADSGLR